MAVTMESKRDVIAIEVGDCTEIHDTVLFGAIYEGGDKRTITVKLPARVAKFTDTTIETMLNKARGEGQAEAWELARRIVNCAYSGGYSSDELHDIFGHYTARAVLCDNTSYAEAQAKVIAWENELHVGDVVVNEFGTRAVVTCVTGYDKFYVMYTDGSSTEQYKPSWHEKPENLKLKWKKTGESIKLDDIFEAIKDKKEE